MSFGAGVKLRLILSVCVFIVSTSQIIAIVASKKYNEMNVTFLNFESCLKFIFGPNWSKAAFSLLVLHMSWRKYSLEAKFWINIQAVTKKYRLYTPIFYPYVKFALHILPRVLVVSPRVNRNIFIYFQCLLGLLENWKIRSRDKHSLSF